ncbi:hypothetical protein Tco_0393382 [Tanacetum coccineum]
MHHHTCIFFHYDKCFYQTQGQRDPPTLTPQSESVSEEASEKDDDVQSAEQGVPLQAEQADWRVSPEDHVLVVSIGTGSVNRVGGVEEVTDARTAYSLGCRPSETWYGPVMVYRMEGCCNRPEEPIVDDGRHKVTMMGLRKALGVIYSMHQRLLAWVDPDWSDVERACGYGDYSTGTVLVRPVDQTVVGLENTPRRFRRLASSVRQTKSLGTRRQTIWQDGVLKLKVVYGRDKKDGRSDYNYAKQSTTLLLKLVRYFSLTRGTQGLFNLSAYDVKTNFSNGPADRRRFMLLSQRVVDPILQKKSYLLRKICMELKPKRKEPGT